MHINITSSATIFKGVSKTPTKVAMQNYPSLWTWMDSKEKNQIHIYTYTYIDTCQLKSVKERLWFQFDFNRLFDLFWPYFIIFIITFLILINIITTIFIITSLITMLKWCRCGGATSSLKTDNQLIIARGRPHFCYVRMPLPSSSTCNILQYQAIPMHTQTNK